MKQIEVTDEMYEFLMNLSDELNTQEEIKEEVIKYKEWDGLEEDEANKLFSELDSWEIDEIMEENWRKVNIDYEPRYENAFLTSKACDEHIRVNKHNLRSPINYLSGAFRNPELEMVMKFLCELNGGKLHT